MRKLARFAACVAIMSTPLLGCSDEPTPNAPPEIVAGSATISCEDSGDADIGDVLIGGSLLVIDANLEAVTVDLGGLETIALGTDQVEAEPDVAQTWSFTFDPARKVRCDGTLVLTFTARDAKGELVTVSKAAP